MRSVMASAASGGAPTGGLAASDDDMERWNHAAAKADELEQLMQKI